MITTRRLMTKINPKIYAVTQHHTQLGNINTNLKVKIDFILYEISAAKIVTWDFHVDKSSKGRYDMILGRYILTALRLNFKISDHVIEENDVTFKGLIAPMADLCMC